ncbi:hypothetical protein RDI58_014822 [Solanum bulbocastanum]|uniref:Uncharacterized protein n=1 Tax=Solanum bulbocastanum TaxID=147425 RepID=A0AAN8YBD6_SOLBU
MRKGLPLCLGLGQCYLTDVRRGM